MLSDAWMEDIHYLSRDWARDGDPTLWEARA